MMAVVLLLYLVLIHIVPDSWNHPLIYINPMFRIVDFCIGIYLCLLWKAFPHENSPFYFNSVIELLAGIISVFFILVYPFIAVRYSLASLYWIPSVILILAFVKSESGGGGHIFKDVVM